MTRLTINLSDDLRRDVEALAGGAGVSPGEFVARHVGEVVRQRQRFERMRREVADADPTALRRYLDSVPDVEPAAGDELPDEEIDGA